MCNSVAARVVLAGGCLLAMFLNNETTCGESATDNPPPNLATLFAPLADTNIANSAYIPWGYPWFTDSSQNSFPRPAWVLGAGLDGGLWITNDTWYGWQPALTDWHPGLASNRLLIHLDRALLTNNLWIAVAGSAESNATLLAGFFDAQLLNVADPVVLHVAATNGVEWPATSGVEWPAMSGVEWPAMSGVEWPATSGVEWRTNNLDLLHKPAASVIALSTTNGLMRIYCTALFQNDAVRQTLTAPASSATPATPPASRVSAAFASGNAAMPANVAPANDPPAGPPNDPPGNPPNTPPGLSKGPRTWYVNASTGDDVGRDGTADDCRENSAAGPKRSIAAVLALAAPGDTIVVAAGTYPGRVKLDGIRMITNGRVVLP